MRPFSFAGEGGDVVRGVAEGFYLGGAEVRRDDYEAVALEKGLEVLGRRERHG